MERPGRNILCEFEGAGFEGAADFLQLGFNLTLLGPGEPLAVYHRENGQEDFPCQLLAVGARDRSRGPGWAYPVAEAAICHGAGVERETTDFEEAYARFRRSELTSYREGWLPG